MSCFRLSLYTFAQFRTRAEDPVNDAFFANEPDVWSALERAEGFIARSGYDGDPGPDSWGPQVFPKYWTDNGDGWAPSTVSIWQDLETALAAIYRGPHADIMKIGHLFVKEASSYPPYVLWWTDDGHTPDWREAVERHEMLGTEGQDRMP